jgi:alpha-beta hydrolase superfamily lysophospholipase
MIGVILKMIEQTGRQQHGDAPALYTVAWLPDDGSAKASVLILHGIAEHIGRYQHVAEYLTGRGYAVYGMDHRGHGRSEGRRTYIESFDDAVDDIQRYAEHIQAQTNERPLFLLGHSMGTVLAMMYVLRSHTELAGLITSGSTLDLDKRAPALVRMLLRGLARVVPRMPLIPLDVSGLVSDPNVVAEYAADPLVDTRPLQPHMVQQILENDKIVRERLLEVRLPLLILHGEEDSINPSSGSRYLFEKALSSDKLLHVYPGMRHEILQEPRKQIVLQDIGDWLDAHV